MNHLSSWKISVCMYVCICMYLHVPACTLHVSACTCMYLACIFMYVWYENLCSPCTIHADSVFHMYVEIVPHVQYMQCFPHMQYMLFSTCTCTCTSVFHMYMHMYMQIYAVFHTYMQVYMQIYIQCWTYTTLAQQIKGHHPPNQGDQYQG